MMKNNPAKTIEPIIMGGNIFWYNSDGKYHREDGPAEEIVNGSKVWWINGERHRDDGPAMELANGRKVWFIKGINITNEVEQWIIDNNFPEYEEWDDWDDSIKVLFKLTFG